MFEQRTNGLWHAIAIVLTIWLAHSSAVAQRAPKVVNGRPALPTELYGTVALADSDRSYDLVDRLFCTGTLIAPTVVLTAAHCVFECGGRGDACIIRPISPRTVVVASGFRDAHDSYNAEIIDVDRIAIHEGYEDFPWDAMDVDLCVEPFGEHFDSCDVFDTPGLGLAHDIALLTLRKPVTAVDVVPVLPKALVSDALASGSVATVTGYGSKSDEDSFFDETPFDEGALLNIAPTGVDRVAQTEILTFARAGEGDACFGDSGGPLYVEANGSLYLAGITSRGRADVPEYCGAGGIYTLASAYTEWIDVTVRSGGASSRGRGGRCGVAIGANAPAPWWLWLFGVAYAARAGALSRRCSRMRSPCFKRSVTEG